jgi:hypothetical protein
MSILLVNNPQIFFSTMQDQVPLGSTDNTEGTNGTNDTEGTESTNGTVAVTSSNASVGIEYWCYQNQAFSY